MTNTLLTHPACLSHITPTGHPEQVARLEQVLAALDPLTLQRQAAPMAAEDDLLRAAHATSSRWSARGAANQRLKGAGWGHIFITRIPRGGLSRRWGSA